MEFTKHYLTYNEYKALGGTLEETPFNILELEARKNIDRYTFGRLIDLEEYNNEVKICMYRLIEALDGYAKSYEHDKSISSESIDGYSINYNQTAENVSKGNLETIRGIINTCLAECKLENGTPYLYCGVK